VTFWSQFCDGVEFRAFNDHNMHGADSSAIMVAPPAGESSGAGGPMSGKSLPDRGAAARNGAKACAAARDVKA
jgi:hypothetical protein